MTPAEQATNCLAACVACILELPLEEVPHDLADDWWDRLTDWLHRRNLELVYAGRMHRPKGYAILSTQDEHSSRSYAVVVLDGEVVWSPHPTEEIGETGSYYVFRVLDPTNRLRPSHI